MADRPRADDELDDWIVSTVQQALAFALSLVRDRVEAEDIVHDCYGRLLARADQYDLPRDGSKLLFKWVRDGQPRGTVSYTFLEAAVQNDALYELRTHLNDGATIETQSFQNVLQ